MATSGSVEPDCSATTEYHASNFGWGAKIRSTSIRSTRLLGVAEESPVALQPRCKILAPRHGPASLTMQ